MWRRLSTGGGALLALCFFLPAAEACNSYVVPAKEVSDLLAHPGDLLNVCGVFTLYAAPYLLGALVALAAVSHQRRWHQGLDIGIALVLAACVGSGVALLLEKPETWSAWTVLPLLPTCLTAVYLAVALRRGRAGLRCLPWYAALLCLCWFGFWFTSVQRLYGLWLSVGSCAAMLVGLTWQWVAYLRLPLGATLRRLALADGRTPDKA